MQIWPDPKPMSQELYGSLEDLQRTAIFVVKSGEIIWRTRKKKKDRITLKDVKIGLTDI